MKMITDIWSESIGVNVDRTMDEDILDKNIYRLFIMSVVALPISLLFLFYFGYGVQINPIDRIEIWKTNVFYSHAFLASSMLIVGVLSFFIYRKGLINRLLSKSLVFISIIIFVLVGSLLSAFDQYVTNSITPFFLAVIFISTIFIVHPKYLLIILVTGIAFFYHISIFYQSDVNILVSNLFNAIAISAISFILSIVVWNNYTKQFNQAIMIKRQNEALEKQLEVLKESEHKLLIANKNKNRFFSIIAHDLRNPIGSMMNLLNLVTDKKFVQSQTKEELNVVLVEMQKAASNTFYLLENLLYWAKDQEGKSSFSPELVIVKDVLSQVLGTFIISIDQKKIQTKIDQVDPAMLVFADSNMLNTILRNLISNAIKFSHLFGEIVITANREDDVLVIRIEDFGIGIPKNKIDQLFTSEDNYTSSGTLNETGTGLGLALCNEFMKKHNGRIDYISKVSKGAIFQLTFPNKKE